MLTFGSLFSGIGGFDLGFERAGMECKWQVEIDEACNKVLEKHWPNIARYKDVREVGKSNLEPVDVICGGFPCQDVSLAGLRKGLEGKRSTLWTEFYRIVCEIQPRWVVIENVSGLLSSDNGEFFRIILWGLASVGYDAEWRIIKASDFGANHKRERIIIVANRNGNWGQDWSCLFKSKTITEWDYESFWGREFQVNRLDSSLRAKLDYGEKLESKFLGMVDGIPGQLDRIKQCGNAVVPQMAEWIGKRIIEASQ